MTGVVGGAFQGHEIAGILFTNSSAHPCSIRGFPFAQLRLHGKPLGEPATHDPGKVRTVVLKRHASAESQLTAVSTCQAPRSDRVRVRPPGLTASTDVPLDLRGCSLSIGPVKAA